MNLIESNFKLHDFYQKSSNSWNNTYEVELQMEL